MGLESGCLGRTVAENWVKIAKPKEISYITTKDWTQNQLQVNNFFLTVLTLNFLNDNEKGTKAVERHWTIEKNYELNQPSQIYWPQNGNKDIYYIGEGFYFCFHRRRKNIDIIKIN